MLVLALGGIVSIIVAATISFGSRVVTGGETTAVLTTQVQLILETNKDQSKLLQEILVKQADLYTRREAQADREAAERRFQSMEGRIGDIGRRLEAVESSQRFMQQMIVDKSARRP